jgi:hypothetical protein
VPHSVDPNNLAVTDLSRIWRRRRPTLASSVTV